MVHRGRYSESTALIQGSSIQIPYDAVRLWVITRLPKSQEVKGNEADAADFENTSRVVQVPQ